MSPESPTCPTCGLALDAGQRVCPEDGTVLELDDTEPTLTRDVLIGQQLGEYLVEQRIGCGGMGIVYRGRQPLISKTVAIKILRPDLSSNAVEVARILAEARTVNAIGHRGIIDIFGFGTVPDGRQYLVMEYLDGAPLDKVIADRAPMPYQEVLPILDELLDALGACHAAGVVHRDLKPSNIFLATQRTGAAYVKILDFGLAKQSAQPGGEVRQTRQSMVCGTPEFMAPEQARGMAVSPRTDLYALGCIAYEMLTGRLPFSAASAVELMMAHIEKAPSPPSALCKEVPQALDDLLLRLLAKDPDQRPANAGIVRGDLKRLRRDFGGHEAAFRVPRPLDTVPPRQALRPNAREDAEGIAETALVAPAPLPLVPVGRRPTAPEPERAAPVAEVAPPSASDVRAVRKTRAAWIAGGLGALLVASAVIAVVASRGEELPVPQPVQVVTAEPIAVVEPAGPPEPAAVPAPPPEAPAEEPGQAAVTPDPAVAAAEEPAGTDVEPAAASAPSRPAPRRREPGVLEIHMRGWGEVYIDGKREGRIPPDNRFTLPAGRHELEIRQADRVITQQQITIQPRRTLKQRVEVK